MKVKKKDDLQKLKHSKAATIVISSSIAGSSVKRHEITHKAVKTVDSLQEVASQHELAYAIYIKEDPATGVKDVFSRCSKCGMVGTCKIQEEQLVQIEGEPFRLGIARCFWMEHNFRVLLSK